MTFHNVTGSTADTFMEYIQRNLPEGVAMKVTKVSTVFIYFKNSHLVIVNFSDIYSTIACTCGEIHQIIHDLAF